MLDFAGGTDMTWRAPRRPVVPGTDPSGHTVLVRISFGTAHAGDHSRNISHEAAGAIRALSQAGARVVVIGGLGDPGGDINQAFSLKPYASALEEATGCPVRFIGESVGSGAEAGVATLEDGDIALLENIRFHTDERRHAWVFAVRLSVLGDCFIDLGNPPSNPDGWQAALGAILPLPSATKSRETH